VWEGGQQAADVILAILAFLLSFFFLLKGEQNPYTQNDTFIDKEEKCFFCPSGGKKLVARAL